LSWIARVLVPWEIYVDGELVVSGNGWTSLKRDLKIVTKKTTPSTFDERIARLKEIQRGWVNYFRMGSIQAKLKEIDGWLCNRLRYCIWEDWKKAERKRKNLIRLSHRSSLCVE